MRILPLNNTVLPGVGVTVDETVGVGVTEVKATDDVKVGVGLIVASVEVIETSIDVGFGVNDTDDVTNSDTDVNTDVDVVTAVVLVGTTDNIEVTSEVIDVIYVVVEVSSDNDVVSTDANDEKTGVDVNSKDDKRKVTSVVDVEITDVDGFTTGTVVVISSDEDRTEEVSTGIDVKPDDVEIIVDSSKVLSNDGVEVASGTDVVICISDVMISGSKDVTLTDDIVSTGDDIDSDGEDIVTTGVDVISGTEAVSTGNDDVSITVEIVVDCLVVEELSIKVDDFSICDEVNTAVVDTGTGVAEVVSTDIDAVTIFVETVSNSVEADSTSDDVGTMYVDDVTDVDDVTTCAVEDVPTSVEVLLIVAVSEVIGIDDVVVVKTVSVGATVVVVSPDITSFVTLSSSTTKSPTLPSLAEFRTVLVTVSEVNLSSESSSKVTSYSALTLPSVNVTSIRSLNWDLSSAKACLSALKSRALSEL